jgi:nucleoid-associated protein EbfC
VVNMMKLMKQAQSMQKNMEKLQAELAAKTFEFSAGGGVVKAVAQGDNTIVSVTIDPKAADPGDVEMLQDMVLTAVNGALKLARDAASDEMAKITGGMGLGGMPGFG